MRIDMMRRVLVIGALAAVVGCAPQQGPQKYAVEGTVLLDGAPLAQGHIVFMPVERSAAPDAGMIEDGRFAFEASPGRKRVEITAMRDSGEIDPQMGQQPREQFVADRFNVESELTAEVSSGGPNRYQFDVTAK